MTSNTILKGAIIILICLFGTYVFLYPPNEGEGTANTPVIVPGAMIDSTMVCMDYNSYRPSTLPTGLINEMVSIYRTNQLAAIQNAGINPVRDDAYSIWFDLDTIKKFIYHIEKGVQQNGTAGGRLGLRMYYAAYPDSTRWNTHGYEDLAGFSRNATTREYGRKHTLVMIPTIGLASGADSDFNPFVRSTYASGLENPRKILQGDNPRQEPETEPDFSNPAPVMALTPTGENQADSKTKSPTARNHGNLYPPGNTANLGF